MSDLFDALSTRFTATETLAIRPRPTSRFEATKTPDALVEEDNVIPVRAPEAAPKVASQRVTQQLTPREQNTAPLKTQLPPDTEYRSARTPSKNTSLQPERKKERVSDHHSHHLSDDPSTDYSVPVSPVFEPRPERAEPSIATEVSEAAPKPDPEETLQGKPFMRQSQAESDESRKIETRVVEASDTSAEMPEAVQLTRPDTIVRIGRVEMRQPTPPPQPAPPSAPRAKPANDAVRMTAVPGKGGGRSGLTDYLGWKRR